MSGDTTLGQGRSPEVSQHLQGIRAQVPSCLLTRIPAGPRSTLRPARNYIVLAAGT